MDRLITLLREVEANETIPNNKHAILNGDYETLENAMRICTKEIQSLATELFIDEDGRPRFDDMDVLQQISGFYIFPGERDRCGWLTACIQTKKGIIVFG
jgi:hypothetical protein